jgi:HSP20 family protein
MRLIPYTHTPEPAFRLRPQTAQFFEEFFNSFPVTGSIERNGESWIPAVDILEKDGKLMLRAELPGMNEKEIDLKIEGQVLTLKGERKIETEENTSAYQCKESHHGTFSRSFTLPETVESDKIKAEYKQGILTVTIPLKPEVQPREIPVSVVE